MAKRANKKRIAELERRCEESGLFFCTYSPGDGMTRYRFFSLADANPEEQDYFGPKNGIDTALGIKKAEQFIDRYQKRRSGDHRWNLED